MPTHCASRLLIAVSLLLVGCGDGAAGVMTGAGASVGTAADSAADSAPDRETQGTADSGDLGSGEPDSGDSGGTPPRHLVLDGCDGTLEGPSHTFTFSDDGAIDAQTRYDIWVDGVDFSDSVAAPTTSILATGLPTDGRVHNVCLRPPAGYDEDPFSEVCCDFGAAEGVLGADYEAIKALVDAANAGYQRWDTYPPGNTMTSLHGYYMSASLWGQTQAYFATGENHYMDAAIDHSHKWIDSGVDRTGQDMNLDGYLDWIGTDNNSTDINIEHHEWKAAAGIASTLLQIRRTGYEGGIPGSEIKLRDFLRREVWDKWAPGHNQWGNGYLRSSRSTDGSALTGRWAMVAMALDKYDPNPGNNEYATYINSQQFRTFLETFVSMTNGGIWKMQGWVGRTDAESIMDTSHASDMAYAIMQAAQLGYNPGGFMPAALANYEALLDTIVFTSAAGPTEWTDGTGPVNSSSQGHALSAAFSETLRTRWVEYFLHNDPSWNDRPNHLVWMGGSLMWALAGNTL